jgi:acetolactate synthase-1/2/3 large subunit
MRFITPRGLGGLGWGVPAAIGAKLAAPSSPVICIAGDGGFAYLWSELGTLARNELPVVIVILNNQRLGFQVAAEDRLMGGHSPGAEFKPVDHAGLARAAGCRALRIEDPSALAPALRDALASNGPVLLDVIVDPDAVPPINGLE